MTLKTMKKELFRLVEQKEEFAELYMFAFDYFVEITRKVTRDPNWKPGPKEATAFFNAALWEWFHHVWIVDRGDNKSLPKLEKG